MALLPILDEKLPAAAVQPKIDAIRALGLRLEFVIDNPDASGVVRLRAQQVNCFHCPESR